MTSSMNRRALVKGAAWTAPAVLATATLPAYAASSSAGAGPKVIYEDSCNTPGLGYSYDYGSKIEQSFKNWISMSNLPKNVYVGSIVITHWMPVHDSITNGHLNNFFPWNSQQLSPASPAQVNVSSGTITWTPKTACSGWSSTATATGVTSHVFGDGKTYNQTFKAVSITTTWDSKQANCGLSNYVDDANGVTKSFNTYDSGPLMLYYSRNFWAQNNDYPSFDAFENVMVFNLVDDKGNSIGTINKTIGGPSKTGVFWEKYPVLTVNNNVPDNPLKGYVSDTHRDQTNPCEYLAANSPQYA